MTVQIALLRGINVGGHNKLPMAELREILSGLGARDVKTYIQSGNAVFRGSVGEDELARAIQQEKGFSPQVMHLSLSDLERSIDENPFPDAVSDPKALHLFFLAQPSNTSTAKLDSAKSEVERYVLTDRVLYLHTPKYLSGSKLAVQLEKLLGVPITGRNWRSVIAIRDLARDL